MPDTSVPRYLRSPNAVEAEVAGLKVMLDVEAGNYYGLDEVGSYLWTRLAEPRSLADLVAELTARYDVAAAEAETATRAFLDDLAGRGLVEPA